MSPETIVLPLFLPATRPERLAKAVASGADAVILDLEDAVAPEHKQAARAALASLSVPAGATLLVRLNAVGSLWHADDLALCARLPVAGLMLAKAESAAQCRDVADRTGKPVVALIETALGLSRAREIAGAAVRIAFGSIDYAADLGLAHLRGPLAAARSELVLACRLAGRAPPLDGVTTAIGDLDLIRDDSRHAREMGMGGKLLIHPAQVVPAREGLAPTVAETDWARRVLAASDAAAVVDGAMVDAPVRLRAAALLARAPA